jgi:hypothetical protein
MHFQGVPGERQQPLRAELQMPRPHRQESQGAVPVTDTDPAARPTSILLG